MKYRIQQPDYELSNGYFTIVIKYLALFAVTWIACWLLLLFLPKSGLSGSSFRWISIFLLHPAGMSVLLGIAVIGYYSLSLYKRAKYGVLTTIDFRKDVVKLILFNPISGSSTMKDIPTPTFKVHFKREKHLLYGQQRIFELSNDKERITILNIDRTAWCRHSEVDELMKKLETYNRK